jgi:hypothetical protein
MPEEVHLTPFHTGTPKRARLASISMKPGKGTEVVIQCRMTEIESRKPFIVSGVAADVDDIKRIIFELIGDVAV